VAREAIFLRGESKVVFVIDPLPPSTGADVSASAAASAAADAAQGGPPAPRPSGVARQLTVRTGTDLDGLVAIEIVDGGELAPGAPVVTLGGVNLATGMPVVVLPPAPAAPAAAKTEAPQ
jgi:hypothetical protein